MSTARDAAELLVSELVTNAVLHARTQISVEVLAAGDLVRITVHDASTVIPKPRIYGTDSTTGRGLRLIATIARSWGVQRERGGKAVWCEVRAEDAAPAPLVWDDHTDAAEALLAAFDDQPAGRPDP
jgi:anti-sigma regulatory factor (Ser/Thr protein kinase)